MSGLVEWSESQHPRDDHGRFGDGGGSEKHAPAFVRTIRGEDLQKSYEGVSPKLIREVHEYTGATGLKALIVRKDDVKVYVHTDEHNQQQSDAKFARAVQLSKVLSRFRDRVQSDLRSSDPKTRELAAVTSLIDHHCIRIGGSDAEEKTGSSGASTLKAEHVFHPSDGSTRLMFAGKSGVRWSVTVTDQAVAKVVNEFSTGKKQGQQLFHVAPQAVNAYIRAKAGIDTSAKDFRTLHASRLAKEGLDGLPAPKTAKDVEANIKLAVEKAARVLGHTPAVCRSTYINPRVIDQYVARHSKAV